MTSVLNVDSIAAKDGTSPVELTKQSAAKSWAGTSGSGTPVIDDSLNTASVTDNGTGDYTFTFSNSMNNANYSALSGGERSAQTQALISGHISKSTTAHQHRCTTDGGGVDDMFEASYLVHGDLA
jgi:hypothetical protein